MKKREQILGSILGGAIGDALGRAYEGHKPPIMIDYSNNWQLSDDTQMTLATCEAISKCGNVDAATIAATFVKWHRQSRFTGLGASTYKALTELCQGGHWALVGRKGEMAAGNGAAMRIAPLAFFLDPNDHQVRQTIRDVSRITHHNEEAYVGALAVILAVRAAWLGQWNGDNFLISQISSLLPDSSVRDRLLSINSLHKTISLKEIAKQFGCSGYVVESVPLAIYGAQCIKLLGFKKMLEELVIAGGDTDTIASLAGQIAGALIGCNEIPTEMISRLPEKDLILRIANEFTEVVLKFNQ